MEVSRLWPWCWVKISSEANSAIVSARVGVSPWSAKEVASQWIMSDQYAHVVKSSLKWKTKGPADAGVKKKKKKSKESVGDSAKLVESLGDVSTSKSVAGSSTQSSMITKTPAEQKFQEMQEKRQMERILKKAEKTHKQRVEDFNKQHLDSLSEHYDIPKVSWTK